MSALLIEATTPQQVYERCLCYEQLLRNTGLPVVARLAATVRNWKSRHHIPTHEEAFVSYRDHIFHPPSRKRRRIEDAAPAAAAQPTVLQVQPQTDDVRLQPHREAAEAHSSNQPISLSVSSKSDGGNAVLAKLIVELAEVRALKSCRPSFTLPTKCVDKRYHRQLKVVPILGDGRCQLYALLQSDRAMIPTSLEADELRQHLQHHLLTSYSSDEEWHQRVPVHFHESHLTRTAFAERYLSQPRTHLPFDTLALWQDMRARATDVYIIHQSEYSRGTTSRGPATTGEYIDRVRCRGTATDAIVLRFTWDGQVGHYELVIYSDVISLPAHHQLIAHLSDLHEAHLAGITKDAKRAAAASSGSEERYARDEAEVE